MKSLIDYLLTVLFFTPMIGLLYLVSYLMYPKDSQGVETSGSNIVVSATSTNTVIEWIRFPTSNFKMEQEPGFPIVVYESHDEIEMGLASDGTVHWRKKK